MFKKIIKILVLGVVSGIISALFVLLYQNIILTKNIFKFLEKEININIETLKSFNHGNDSQIPLSWEQNPNKYWNTLNTDELEIIYICDVPQNIEKFYNELNILKEDYNIFKNIFYNNQIPAKEFSLMINKKEENVLNLANTAQSSIKKCKKLLLFLSLRKFLI